MNIPKRYNPKTAEPNLQDQWQETGLYFYDPEGEAPVYSIDTPPATVSGKLHMGHVYSYSHADFVARFWRMNGHNVFYPMGFDDNGLPTDRLVERLLGVRAIDIGRSAFIEKCLEVSEKAEKEYRQLWTRLGLSIDWRYTYRTIDDHSRRLAQHSFLELLNKGLAYRKKAPAIWCPECQTAIAQAELDDMDRDSIFYTLAFELDDGQLLPIATTRPELLPACVAVFVHPEDSRFAHLASSQVRVPLFGQTVPLLADPGADPQKGSGAVMCCTFGDTADVEWWHTHNLPLVEAIARDGRMTQAAHQFQDMDVAEARRQIIEALSEMGQVLERLPVSQSVRVHERCDTPVEYIITDQWFVRLLDYKAEFLAAGEQVAWHPPYMGTRYRQWVENLNWDWGLSRQRYFGVPFPVWYCDACDTIITANEEDLPVDPLSQAPDRSCPTCGTRSFTAEADVMDTWATSSLSPQIVSRWPDDPQLYERVYPFSCRPQAHEIIRTWAFYTIVKSHFHFDAVPWSNALISGWGLAPAGTAKLSKSRGGGPVAPLEMFERYSADAVRYWAASTGLGKDAVISEERIQAGAKLVNKVWNVARFSGRFLQEYRPPAADVLRQVALSAADRWILARTHALIQRCTQLWQSYDYAGAKSEVEIFFWRDLADNYLEMVKKRLYDDVDAGGARFALYESLLATIKLLAPILPHVTERIYQGLFAEMDGASSIHRARWPAVNEMWLDETAASLGDSLVAIATAVRRYKSENNLSLGAELAELHLATADPHLTSSLRAATIDLISITRARQITIDTALDPQLEGISVTGDVHIALVA
ncbi:MAG: valine--tRNA ligase [Anaerolineaceae bacterium]|nr:MAG: valine--tRNA ligase [Anaerolineaceae bacterium]